jgi:archaellum biogenesis ATPase FlaH
MMAHGERVWSAEQCARLLQKPKRSPQGWKACCPAHEDSEPSLFLADGENGVALVCYAGCTYQEIATHLTRMGAVLRAGTGSSGIDRSRIPDSHYQLGAPHSFWDYRNAVGEVIMRVCRWEQPNGRKDIRPIIRTADGWKWAHHETPRPLFQLDRLTNEPELPVIMVEGEKTAVAAQRLFKSHIVTTWPGGAASTGQADLSALAGRDVILIPDCDAPGRKAMAWVAQHLKGISRSTRTIDPSRMTPGLPVGWDLADPVPGGVEVTAWLKEAAPPSPRLIDLGFTVKEAKTHTDLPYLVKDLFDRGQLIVLWGAPGSGKTFLALHLACHIGAGVPWVGRRVKHGTVLYVCSESTRTRLENRVSALRDMRPELGISRVYFVPVQLDLLHGEDDIMDVIEAAAALKDVSMIVVDTLAVTFGGGDENSSEDMSRYVSNMKRIKAETGAAVLMVHHCGKDESRGMRGHSALLGALDAEFSVEKQEPAADWPSRVLKAGKLREGLSNSDVFAFDLKVRSLGLDPDGDEVSTCVVTPSSVSGGMLRRPSVGTQVKLLAALERAHKEGRQVHTEKEVREMARDLMSRNVVTPAILGLLQADFIRRSVGGIMLSHPPETAH